VSGADEQSLGEAIAASGLVEAGSGGVVLLSGGADSCALAYGLSRLDPRPEVHAVHVNYGLRPESGEDEATSELLCRRLGIGLTVFRPERSQGNVHAWARDERYRAAEQVRRDRGLDWVAVAHTASDLAETMLYRLAVSPGTRALAALPARRGAVIRPLLGLSRAQVRRLAEEAGLGFVDDRSNSDPAYARSRIRHEVMPVLAELNPSVLETLARTRADLGEELDFLATAGSELVETGPDGSRAIPVPSLSAAHPAVRRFALRSLAESALDRQVPVSTGQALAILRLAAGPEGGKVDLGRGAFLVAESGCVRVEADAPAAEPPVTLGLPGSVEWGNWTIAAEPMEPPFEPSGPDVATLDLDRLGERLEVRSWREGDRIRPLGLGGSKTVQDLFTDRRLPRSRRRVVPLLIAAGEVAWIPGIAVAEPFRIGAGTRRAVRLTARRADGSRSGRSPDWA
jgi:tRNA(Ile)-lysidine synthase